MTRLLSGTTTAKAISWLLGSVPTRMDRKIASRSEGSWSPVKRVIAAAGWDDPSPFWDDDGKGYLVATRFSADEDGQKYRIHLFSMTADNDGVVRSEEHTSELQ